MDQKDAFDRWWEWAEKPLDSPLMIDAEIHEAVMALPPDERRDRAKVNEAARISQGSALIDGRLSDRSCADVRLSGVRSARRRR